MLQYKQHERIIGPSRKSTGNVIHYLSVRSSGNVQERVDVGPHSVALLSAHAKVALHVGGVIVNYGLDLLQDYVKPCVRRYRTQNQLKGQTIQSVQ